MGSMDKEIQDIVEPPLPPEKSRLWLIPVTVITTLGIVAIGLYFSGFLSKGDSSSPSSATSSSATSGCVSAADAKNYVGKNRSVCGNVASATYASRTKGSPTFLNLDKAYPNQVFTVVIWGSDRNKFGTPEADYRGKNIKVTGLIELYRGSPEIVVKEPSQIALQ